MNRINEIAEAMVRGKFGNNVLDDDEFYDRVADITAGYERALEDIRQIVSAVSALIGSPSGVRGDDSINIAYLEKQIAKLLGGE